MSKCEQIQHGLQEQTWKDLRKAITKSFTK